jgi:hypothetical protein
MIVYSLLHTPGKQSSTLGFTALLLLLVLLVLLPVSHFFAPWW